MDVKSDFSVLSMKKRMCQTANEFVQVCCLWCWPVTLGSLKMKCIFDKWIKTVCLLILTFSNFFFLVAGKEPFRSVYDLPTLNWQIELQSSGIELGRFRFLEIRSDKSEQTKIVWCVCNSFVEKRYKTSQGGLHLFAQNELDHMMISFSFVIWPKLEAATGNRPSSGVGRHNWIGWTKAVQVGDCRILKSNDDHQTESEVPFTLFSSGLKSESEKTKRRDSSVHLLIDQIECHFWNRYVGDRKRRTCCTANAARRINLI